MRVAVGVGCRLGCGAGAIEAVVRRALASVDGEVVGAGDGAWLIVPRMAGGGVTCAVARCAA